MKKIFAIALALVMVLSMASAFAFCDVVDWSTTANCGMGKVEVLTYAKGNVVGGNSFTQTDCAGAVNGNEVYFAIQVTVDPNPNQDWWRKAVLTVTESGLTVGSYDAVNKIDAFQEFDKGIDIVGASDTVYAGTYYLAYNGGWKLQKNLNLFLAKVDDAAAAKVCATLVSEGKSDQATVEINGYDVIVSAIDTTNKEYAITVGDVVFLYNSATGALKSAKVNGHTYDRYINDTFIMDAGTGTDIAEATCKNVADYNAIKNAMAAINITWTQAITRGKAVASLYKYDKVEDCATWNSDVLAVVNPDCFVMEIPKTGDASVLAWLF